MKTQQPDIDNFVAHALRFVEESAPLKEKVDSVISRAYRGGGTFTCNLVTEYHEDELEKVIAESIGRISETKRIKANK